jgi:hypothetical protein
MAGQPGRSAHSRLGALPLYLSASGTFLRPADGLFRRRDLPLRVEAFIQRFMPLFTVPPGIAGDLRAALAPAAAPAAGAAAASAGRAPDLCPVSEMTPTTLRKFLRASSRDAKHGDVAAAIAAVPGLALQVHQREARATRGTHSPTVTEGE